LLSTKLIPLENFKETLRFYLTFFKMKLTLNFLTSPVNIGILCVVLNTIVSEARLVMSDAELKAVNKLRPMVKAEMDEPYMRKDAYLVRYIKWAKLDVSKAAKKLADVHKWRRDNGINTITQEKGLEENSAGKGLFDIKGVDREGEPVYTFQFGLWNLRKAVLAGKAKETIRHWDQIIEGLAERIRELDRGSNNVTRFTIVCDMNGYSPRTHACLNCITLNTAFPVHLMTYWPEIWKRIFVINTPALFVPLLNTFKAFVVNSEGGSIQSFGSNPSEWQPEILKYIAPDQLAPNFGGSKKVRQRKQFNN